MVTEFGNYISIVKLAIFWAVFMGTLPLLAWIHRDAKAIGADVLRWTAAVLACLVFGTIIWWIIPIYILGLLFYIVAIGTVAIAYIREHNRHAMPFDKLLTVDHIKRLLSKKAAQAELSSEFVFVTKNNNPVPTPQPKTPDFYGYKVAYDVISEALRRRVASITFRLAANGQTVIYEIDGLATKEPEMPREQMAYLLRFVKLLADVDLNERRKPQQGIFRIWKGKDSIEWEVKTAGSVTAEQMQIRRIFKDAGMRLSEIGLANDQAAALQDIGKRKQGIFIISGPQKSGVTTTFYAFLREHDAYINSVQTLETEISEKLPSVTQELYSLSDTATQSYADKLESMIRLGADIIGVAECKDQQTAKVICRAAREGKMLYVVLKADSALNALGIWLKLVGDRKAALADLVGVTCQRLVRKLCENCKQAYTPNPEILKRFNLPADKIKALYKASGVIYDKKGRESTCPQCQGTGFVGRTGLFEIIFCNDELRQSLYRCKSLSEMGSVIRKSGFLSIQEQGLRKVLQGLTAIQELVRVLGQTQKEQAKGTGQSRNGAAPNA
ncbi:MAG: ATPase, T2SS/T4P/T4SS family [Sedimentisphaerales bacterium]|nr:ATPase, T2SS/T4P/T4SS family [Sedimentisphaerales bacterium]